MVDGGLRFNVARPDGRDVPGHEAPDQYAQKASMSLARTGEMCPVAQRETTAEVIASMSLARTGEMCPRYGRALMLEVSWVTMREPPCPRQSTLQN